MHRESNLCMRNNQSDVVLDTCNSFNADFKWNIISTKPESNETITELDNRKDGLKDSLNSPF